VRRAREPRDPADIGVCLLVPTFSPLTDDVAAFLRAPPGAPALPHLADEGGTAGVVPLHVLPSERDLLARLRAFYAPPPGVPGAPDADRMLVLQWVSAQCSAQRLFHAMHLVAKERAAAAEAAAVAPAPALAPNPSAPNTGTPNAYPAPVALPPLVPPRGARHIIVLCHITRQDLATGPAPATAAAAAAPSGLASHASAQAAYWNAVPVHGSGTGAVPSSRVRREPLCLQFRAGWRQFFVDDLCPAVLDAAAADVAGRSARSACAKFSARLRHIRPVRR